jgi:outer membrane protein OmpA-like peptidoglycan-associated protein
MRGIGWKIGTLAVAGVLLGSSVASAENIQHFEPSPGPTGGFTLEDHRTPGHLRLTTDLYANYGREPLVIVDASGKNEQQVVGHMTTFDVLAGITLMDRLLLSVHLPINHVLGDGAKVEDQEGFSLGDIRLLPRARILGGDEGLGLAVAVPVSFPTGNTRGHTGAGAIGFNPKAIVGYDFGGLDAYANLGVRASTDSETIDGTDTKVGAALTYTIGVGYALNTVRLIAEGYGSVPFEDATKKTTTNPLEALAGVRWAFGHGLHLNGGGGLGIIGDAGTPAFRLLLGVGYQAGEHDAADDGPAVDAAISEAPKPEEHPGGEPEGTHAAVVAPATDKPADEDANFAEGGEAEAAVADGARAAESQALAERRRQEGEAAAAAERKRAEEAAAEAERAEARRLAAAEVAADDGEPPPNHGKKRREARPTAEESGEDAVAEVPDTQEDAPPKKPKKPKADADGEGSGGGLEIREAPEGRVLALGRETGAGKKGGHKKRPSVYFSEGSTTLDRRAEKELEKLAALFERAPKNAKLRISGHADNLASPEVSLKQSRKRAQAVKAWLVDNGVPAKRIVLEWFGDTAPIGKNKTEAGRSVNRRVDYAFVVFDE